MSALPDDGTLRYWIACVHDRHTIPEMRMFHTRERAIAWATASMHECVAHPEGLRIDDDPETNMWHMTYEYASDYAFVRSATLLGQ